MAFNCIARYLDEIVSGPVETIEEVEDESERQQSLSIPRMKRVYNNMPSDEQSTDAINIALAPPEYDEDEDRGYTNILQAHQSDLNITAIYIIVEIIILICTLTSLITVSNDQEIPGIYQRLGCGHFGRYSEGEGSCTFLINVHLFHAFR